MRLAWSIVGVLAGCGGGDKTVANTAPPDAPIARLDLPRMDLSKRVLLLAKAKPAALVWVDAKGQLSVGETGPTWNGTLNVPAMTSDVPPSRVRRRVLDAIRGAAGPRADAASFEIQKLVATDPLPVPLPITGRAIPSAGRLPGASFAGLAAVDKLAPLIVATPSAPATAIAEVVRETGGVIAVDHLGKLAALDVAFDRDRGVRMAGEGSWIEISVDATGVHVMKQPEERDSVVPWVGASIDHAAVADRLKALDDGAKLTVDLLVREDTTAQTLVDILAALADHDIHPSLIKAPATPAERHDMLERMQRGLPPVADVAMGQPNAQGDLDKAKIRDTVRAQIGKIHDCYDQALLARPGLEGTVAVQFFIAPTGKVTAASASGVDPGLDKCVADTIRGFDFPQPDGGGGVQVMYPFTFRSRP